jgi:transketolase
MLNPELKLNPKIFDEDVELQPTRSGFGEALDILGDSNPNVVVLTADLNESTRCEKFAQKHPDRFFEMGVAEQNMAAVAAGLGVSGKVAFISSYATFSPGKNWETIRTTIVYNQANVKIAGHHSGVVTGPDGATHQATEDIAIMRVLPDIQVIDPCDSVEAQKATIESANTPLPVYIRFTRDKTPVMTTNETPYSDKVLPFWISNSPQATIFSTGYMTYYALLAAKELEGEGVETVVVHVPVIKPLDEEGVMRALEHSKAAVSVEDHQVAGGLGGAIAECLAKRGPMPMEFIGLNDTFAESGKPQEIRDKYGMGVKDIKEAVKKVISRKNNG